MTEKEVSGSELQAVDISLGEVSGPSCMSGPRAFGLQTPLISFDNSKSLVLSPCLASPQSLMGTREAIRGRVLAQNNNITGFIPSKAPLWVLGTF
ncbi:hypothetical protein AAE478_002010 [Parahypoxylon ruwenzoriense]